MPSLHHTRHIAVGVANVLKDQPLHVFVTQHGSVGYRRQGDSKVRGGPNRAEVIVCTTSGIKPAIAVCSLQDTVCIGLGLTREQRVFVAQVGREKQPLPALSAVEKHQQLQEQ